MAVEVFEVGQFGTAEVFLGIAKFVTVSLGAAALGTICALVCCVVTKHSEHVRGEH